MEIVAACLFSYLLGSWTVLLAQYAARRKATVQNEMHEVSEPSRRDEKLREQWDNFLNYNGEEQTGTDE